MKVNDAQGLSSFKTKA